MTTDQDWRVFVSYRRKGGSELASLISTGLSNKNERLNVFVDVNKLDGGRFDQALLENILQSKHFILVLTFGALDRCIDDKNRNVCEDWIHIEVATALQNGSNIIPVIHHDFKWPEKNDLPEDMQDICSFNGIPWNHYYQQASIDEIEKFIVGTENKREGTENEPGTSDAKNAILNIIPPITDLVMKKLQRIDSFYEGHFGDE